MSCQVRRPKGICLAPVLLLVVVATLSLTTDRAGAANTRVSIANFAWSKEPGIDLGERVIWDWIGPDTAHSVTGVGPGGAWVDSDPLTSYPNHSLGDSFEYTFDEPGQFTFACKIHSSVRGTVTVSGNPGDPESDPGPAPEVSWDEVAPRLEEVRPLRAELGYRGKGGELRFAINERALADAEYFRVVRVGSKRRPRWIRQFAGHSEWPTFIGYNEVRFAARSETFPAAPGRYVGLLRATDESGNIAGPVPFRFEIKAKPKNRRAR